VRKKESLGIGELVECIEERPGEEGMLGSGEEHRRKVRGIRREEGKSKNGDQESG
jgi:hypothetical protein